MHTWIDSPTPPLTHLYDAGIENLCAAVVADAVKKWNCGGILRNEAEAFFLSDRFALYGYGTSGEYMIELLEKYGAHVVINPAEKKRTKRGAKHGKAD